MRVIREYLIAVIFSFEFLALCLGFWVYFVFPEYISAISSEFKDSEEVLKYIAVLPFGMAIWVSKENQCLLFPEENKDFMIQQWSDYWRLKVYFKVSLIYSWIFACLGFLIWFLGYKISRPEGFISLLIAIVGESIVVVSTYFAKIKQKEILIKS